MSIENLQNNLGTTDSVRPSISTTTTSANTAPPTGQAAIDAELVEIADCLGRQLRQCQANSLGWLLKAGAYLLEARQELEAGEWTQLFLSDRLPFGLRTAQTLARIADNPALSNGKNLSRLPTSISALEELARLNSALIDQGILDGNVGPAMTAAQAKAFVRQQKQQNQLQHR